MLDLIKRQMYSVEMYQLLELERKRVRTVKQSYQGPIIRYQSVTMPLIEELTDSHVNIEDERYLQGMFVTHSSIPISPAPHLFI